MPQHDSDSISAAASPETPPSARSGQPARGGFLTVRNLVKRFGAHTALADVSLDIRAGELVLPAGPSGCGKTTLLRAIAGLERQDSGVITPSGRDISHAEPQERDYGILFQSYALFPNLTVAQNVAYGLSGKRAHRKHVAGRVEEMLTLVGLAGAANKYPGQISGGQQQRVALARALAPSPSLLLLDEPMSALDARVAPAHRIARAAEAPVHHHADGHARSGRGHGHGRPHRRHERRRHRAVRHAARTLPPARLGLHRRLRGRGQLAAVRAHRRAPRPRGPSGTGRGRGAGRRVRPPVRAPRGSARQPCGRNSPTPCWPTCSTACSWAEATAWPCAWKACPAPPCIPSCPRNRRRPAGPHAASRCWVELPRHAIRAYA